MQLQHALRATRGIVERELLKLWSQRGRLISALVRPSLWMLVFAAGFQNVFGVAIQPPYDSYVEYQEYIAPGLLGMVLLFNGMQSSLALVYDREMGMMRLLLTAPLPRWYILLSKLTAGVVVSLLQAYAFLLVCLLFQVDIPPLGFLWLLPALLLSGLMLGALGLLLSVYVKQLENFASTMNFVIFPMFFFSSALYPLWKLQESGADWVYYVALVNPFTHVVELLRFATYGQVPWLSLAVVLFSGALCYGAAVWGYDPQKGAVKKIRRG